MEISALKSRIDPGDRKRRLAGAVIARYAASAPAQAVDADLAILSALMPRRQKRRARFLLLGLGAVLGIPFVGFTQATTNVGGFFPIVIGLFIGLVVGGVMFALRGAPIVLRADKLETARALLRRIDFGAGQNGIALQVTRGSSFAAKATRHTYVATATTITDTVTVMYPPQMNAALPSNGPSVAQHIQRPSGAHVEVMNQPGLLSVRLPYQGPAHNWPEPLAALIAQAVGLVDNSRGYVQIDRDAWPPYQPNEAELAATKI